ncbi:MAG: hypothetical protein H6718_04260 [Polyangiaceae bacterium]|nr:hypothetical protein [Polyangiaceae bacterium]
MIAIVTPTTPGRYRVKGDVDAVDLDRCSLVETLIQNLDPQKLKANPQESEDADPQDLKLNIEPNGSGLYTLWVRYAGYHQGSPRFDHEGARRWVDVFLRGYEAYVETGVV